MSPTALEFTKAVPGVIGAGITYFADLVASNVSGLPGWIGELGLPTAFLICVIYALVATNKALRASESGRLRDRDEYVDAIRQDAKQASETHEKLIEVFASQKTAFDKQANSFDRLNDAVDKLADKIDKKL